MYCLTTTVKEAVQAKKCFQNKKKRLTEVEEEDAYKRLFSCGEVFCRESYIVLKTDCFALRAFAICQNIRNPLIFQRKMATYSCFGGS